MRDLVATTDEGPHWEMLPPPEATRPLVQVVRATPHPHRAADVKLVVVLPTPAGGFRLRWLDIVASDLPSALPHLYDLDPAMLVRYCPGRQT